MTDKLLQFPTDGTLGHRPPYVDLAGIRVHLIGVRALPGPTASKAGKATTVIITAEDLSNPDLASGEMSAH